MPQSLLVVCDVEDPTGGSADSLDQSIGRQATASRLQYEYVGPLAGHDASELAAAMPRIKQAAGRHLLHL